MDSLHALESEAQRRLSVVILEFVLWDMVVFFQICGASQDSEKKEKIKEYASILLFIKE